MQLSDRSSRHTQRIGASSGFSLHYRGSGVNQEKMDLWIKRFFHKKGNLLRQAMAASDFDAIMSVEAIAAGEYLPDRPRSLSGAAAYSREKRKYMKDLGLARADDLIPDRLFQYIQILESGGDRVGFLRSQSMKMKLMCPQSANTTWTPKQNGYRHYRIRPLVMFLYAIRQSQLRKTEANTDDLTLSTFRFFTPRDKKRVDENFLISHIDAYFERKATEGIDYESDFRSLMARVERDLGYSLTKDDEHALARKSRNAGNEVYCTIIFLRDLGLIEATKTSPDHWSCTQQTYERTYRLEFNIVTLTTDGEHALADALSKVPLWYADLVDIFGSQCFREIEIVHRLARGHQLKADEISDIQIQGLNQIGIVLLRENEIYRVEQPPVFELQYDMPKL
ncbi:MAG: hypothetical protein GH143_10725 [Calditrichaeota bacterium]|nr:hypothetical protein [Calditrichota bacterium]